LATGSHCTARLHESRRLYCQVFPNQQAQIFKFINPLTPFPEVGHRERAAHPFAIDL
jgi:hypothetical protein